MAFSLRNRRRIVAIIAAGLACFPPARSSAQALTPDQALARDLLRELIGIDTTHSAGDTTVAAEAMAKRLRDAGFPAADVEVTGPRPKNKNLVARLRGTGARRPILLLAHLDVVEARRDDWSVDPFTLLERDGFFYGRGTSDIKDGAALWVATLIRLKREGYKPDRDIILALTAGEEAGADYNGVQWLLAERRPLVDAEICINADAGDPQIRNGKRIARPVELTEKVYQSFRLTVRSPGGHSSVPSKDNAIYRLADALRRLGRFDFPVDLNEVTRGYFSQSAAIEGGQTGADMKAIVGDPPDPAAIARLSSVPFYNALLRTTCVATMLEAGHAENALPQMATAVVNCRILPTESPADVQQTLIRVVADSEVAVTPLAPARPAPPSRLTPDVLKPIEQVTAALWPGIPILPGMDTGATDGVHLRSSGIPTYGISGVFLDIDDIRAHGRDERISVAAYYDAVPYLYALVKAMSRVTPASP